MVCEHLHALEQALKAANIRELHRGQPWSQNCREWVTFDCYLDLASIRRELKLDACVRDHSNDDPRSGREAGLVCHACWDGIIGVHPGERQGRAEFPVRGSVRR